MCKKNEMLEQMWREGQEFGAEMENFKKYLEVLGDKVGRDSDAYQAMKDEAPQFGFTSGQWKAVRAYKRIDNVEKEIMLGDGIGETIYEDEIADFVKTLKDAKVRRFVVVDESTALMKTLHLLSENGCRMRGLVKLHRNERMFGKETITEILGIKFTFRSENEADDVDEIETVEDKQEEVAEPVETPPVKNVQKTRKSNKKSA